MSHSCASAKTHKNRDVFVLLVNKMPLRRIVEITGLRPGAVYGKIAFIHRLCLSFVAHRERELLHKVLPSMYVAVDRQAHTVNWSTREDRRNIVLNAIGSADLSSSRALCHARDMPKNRDYTLAQDITRRQRSPNPHDSPRR